MIEFLAALLENEDEDAFCMIDKQVRLTPKQESQRLLRRLYPHLMQTKY